MWNEHLHEGQIHQRNSEYTVYNLQNRRNTMHRVNAHTEYHEPWYNNPYIVIQSAEESSHDTTLDQLRLDDLGYIQQSDSRDFESREQRLPRNYEEECRVYEHHH